MYCKVKHLVVFGCSCLSIVFQILAFVLGDFVFLALAAIAFAISIICKLKCMDNKEVLMPYVIVSTVGMLLCGIISVYKKALFLSASIVFALILITECVILIMSKVILKTPRSEGVYTRWEKLLSCISLIFIILSSLIFVDGLRSLTYMFSSISSQEPQYRGVEYYNNENYENYRFGKYVKDCLADHDFSEDAEVIDFYYRDYIPNETIFLNGNTQYHFMVEFSSVEAYNEHFNNITQKYMDYGLPEFGGLRCYLIEKQKLLYGNYMYFIVAGKEECNTMIYLIVIDDVNHDSISALDGPYVSFSGQNIWQELDKKSWST